MVKPELSEVKGYLKSYVAHVEAKTFQDAIHQLEPYELSIRQHPDKGDYRYTEGKWSISEVIQHVIDTERIFCYRLLSIARGDQQNLLGFNQDEFADNALITTPLNGVLEDFKTCRASTLSLINSLHPATWDLKGNANGLEVSPRVLSFLILGHAIHHFKVIQDRYLSS